MAIAIRQAEFFMHNLRARMPFRYGMATLTAVPHLLARATIEVDGKAHVGLAAENLPPKWFVKVADQPYREELAAMLHVVETAFGFAEQLGEQASVFDLWQAVYAQQMTWAIDEGYPPLLANFGVSMAERAAIDAYCRAKDTSFARALHANALGIELSELHKELADAEATDLLPSEPLDRVWVRHTVGLSDPLTDADIPDAERVDDGLPQSLASAIEAYGLRYFKIKLCGDVATDGPRLARIAALLAERSVTGCRVTLDGNEQFAELGAFAEYWPKLTEAPGVGPIIDATLAVEQPLVRDVATGEAVAEALDDWLGPPMIIDESDGLVSSLGSAIDDGYAGGSAKGCKGVIKAVAHQCLTEYRRRVEPDRPWVFTAEDLATVGPVGLLEDLAVVAALGIDHVERNGHHYFKGLASFSDDVQQAVLAQHGDLYRRHDAGFATLAINEGALRTASVNNAAFGYAISLDLSHLVPLDDWTYESLTDD